MSKIRDHVSDVPVRARLAANRVHVKTSNAWYRTAGLRIKDARNRADDRQDQRNAERGKLPRRDRVVAEVRSRTPVYRDRAVDPATGRKRREDMQWHRVRNESLAQGRAARQRQGRTR